MNESEMGQLIDALGKLLSPHLNKSEPLRRAVGIIGTWLADEARRAGESDTRMGTEIPNERSTPTPHLLPIEIAPAPPEQPLLPSPVIVMTSPPAPIQQLPVTTAQVPLRLGDELVHLPVNGTTNEIGRARLAAQPLANAASINAVPSHDDGTIDLSRIVARCRLKAAACRLQARRLEADAEKTSMLLDEMNVLITKARAMIGCLLWVFNRKLSPIVSSKLLLIGENYDALADTVEAVRKCDESTCAPDSLVAHAMKLLAEASSSLRASMEDVWNREDRDQVDSHLWLRHQSALRRVFIDRYMTEGDCADPRQAADVSRRARELTEQLNGKLNHTRRIKNALNKIKFHARKLAREQSTDSASEWLKIEEALKDLASAGVSPADSRVGDAIIPAANIPVQEGHIPSNALAAALASQSSSKLAADEDRQPEVPSETVLKVRRLLTGRRAVIIGGEARERARLSLQAAFELSHLEWVELTVHGSSSLARPAIIRSDTALVLVLARLAGHQHVEDARNFAKSAGKPFVLLLGGYNADGIAAAVLEQASQKLSLNV